MVQLDDGAVREYGVVRDMVQLETWCSLEDGTVEEGS